MHNGDDDDIVVDDGCREQWITILCRLLFHWNHSGQYRPISLMEWQAS